jgi:hypothetical protein
VAKDFEAQVDNLYQLPVDEFTAARNALAKEAGRDGAAIKGLAKPPLAAWAVNQLYWKARAVYTTLVDAAEEMRKTHKAVLEGKKGDLRAAGREHELALEKALRATVDLVSEGGLVVTDASRHAILNTLRALPTDEPPGRLSRALAPGGFEMLAGVVPKKGQGRASAPGPKAPGTQGPKDQKGSKDLRTQAPRDLQIQREREAVERAIREAEHRARQAEFETARAVRDAAKAEKRLEEARTALEAAKEEAAAAQRDATAAARAREAADRKARDAESALTAAKARRT